MWANSAWVSSWDPIRLPRSRGRIGGAKGFPSIPSATLLGGGCEKSKGGGGECDRERDGDLVEADSELDRPEGIGLFPEAWFRGLGAGLVLALAVPKAEGDGGSRSDIPSWCSDVK